MKKTLLFLLIIISAATGRAQQNVYSRSDCNTGDWGSGNLPWYYVNDNSSKGDPDNGQSTRNDVMIDHNNNTVMSLNGRFYIHRDFTFLAPASVPRTLNYTTNGGFSFSRNLINNSTAVHVFNTPVAVDGSGANITVNTNGGLTFNGPIYTNNYQFFVKGIGMVRLSGPMTQGGSIVKQDSGTLVIENNADFPGALYFDSGTVKLYRNFSGSLVNIGTTYAQTANTATLELNGITVSSPLTVIPGGPRNVNFLGAANQISGAITLQNDLAVSVDTNATISGAISGTSGMLKTGPGTLSLTGHNTYTGLTTVNSGNITLNALGGGTLASAASVSINAGALQVATSQTLQDLTIGSNGTLIINAGATLTISGTLNYNGTIINNGAIAYTNSGNLTYKKATAVGTEWPLTGVPQNVNINAGTVTLDSARTLAGNLTVISSLTLDGNITRVSQGGTFTVSGNLSINPAADFPWGFAAFSIPGQVTYNGEGTQLIPTLNGAQYGKLVTAGTHHFAGDASVGNLQNSGSLFVDGGNDLNVATTIDNSGYIEIAAGANLLQDTNATINTNIGNIKVIRPAKMWRQDYVYWGAPVSGQNLKAFSPETLDGRFYVYDEPTNDFKTVFTSAGLNQNTASYNFVPGKGYMVRAPNTFMNPTSQGALPTQTFNGTFTGLPNNGTITIPVTNSGVGLGYNLLSNPYPSVVNGDLFLQANPGTIYFWSHHDQISGNAVNYATFNRTGGTSAPNYNGAVLPDGSIAVGQGFLYRTENATANATFNNVMRTGNNTALFYREGNVAKSRIWLNLTKGNLKMSQALLAYVQGTTTGFDASYDGKLIEGGSAISSLIGNDRYAIQARDEFAVSDIVPLNLTAAEAGNYAISIDHVDGLFDGNQDIFLQDLDLGVTHNLKTNAYSFTATAGTTASRFRIVYQASPLATPTFDANHVVIYKEHNVININSGEANMAKVQIFDIRGRLIYSRDGINAATTILDDFRGQQGILLVQVTCVEGVTVTRKVAY